MATWSRPGEGRLRAAGRGRRGAYSAHEAGAPVAHSAAAAGGSDSGRGQDPEGGGGTPYLGGEGGDLLLAVRMQRAHSPHPLRLGLGWRGGPGLLGPRGKRSSLRAERGKVESAFWV